MPRHLLAPPIQATSHRGVAHHLPRLSPTAVQDGFDLQHPAVHAFDLRELACPGRPLSHNNLKACQLLRAPRAHRPPFFESRCRLASTSSKAWAASTVAYLKGCSPSVFRAVKIPEAYSSSTASCLASSADALGICFLSCLRTSRTLSCMCLRRAVFTCLSASKARCDASRSAWNWQTWCGTCGHNSCTAKSSLSWASVIVPSTFTPNATTGASSAFITAVSED